MAIDHSLTYKIHKFKNLPHILRLKKIKKILKSEYPQTSKPKYIDIGCSNGYITNLITQEKNIRHSIGLDHNGENIKIAKAAYPYINFDFIDLNEESPKSVEDYNLITCFETLEHVGKIDIALNNIIKYASKNDCVILISVPIEIGIKGIIKFILKTCVYRYSLKELPNNVHPFKYLCDLIKNKNISKYRDVREGWSTHFGFDYRTIDSYLKKNSLSYKTINSFTSRFYIIKQ